MSPTHLDTVPLLLPLIHFIFHLDNLQLQLLLLQREFSLQEEGRPISKGCMVSLEERCASSAAFGPQQQQPGSTGCWHCLRWRRCADRGRGARAAGWGKRFSFLSKDSSRSTHLPGYRHGAAFNHIRVISWRGGRVLFQNSAVYAARGPSQGVPLQQ